uniref:Serine/arginine repetitive matrix protein 2-like n=1 Tax=Rhabditophanes sp. KR3021 TaxID=114890 RepID=A0AC35TMW6_9BILA
MPTERKSKRTQRRRRSRTSRKDEDRKRRSSLKSRESRRDNKSASSRRKLNKIIKRSVKAAQKKFQKEKMVETPKGKAPKVAKAVANPPRPSVDTDTIKKASQRRYVSGSGNKSLDGIPEMENFGGSTIRSCKAKSVKAPYATYFQKPPPRVPRNKLSYGSGEFSSVTIKTKRVDGRYIHDVNVVTSEKAKPINIKDKECHPLETMDPNELNKICSSLKTRLALTTHKLANYNYIHG